MFIAYLSNWASYESVKEGANGVLPIPLPPCKAAEKTSLCPCVQALHTPSRSDGFAQYQYANQPTEGTFR